MAGHELKETEDGTTVKLSITFSGLFAKSVASQFGSMMQEYLAAEAAGLKNRCEAAVLSY